RACRVVGAGRKSVLYRSTRAPDAELREKLRELANRRRRFGYRRLRILLRREGMMINRKRTPRIYREKGLAVRRLRRPPSGRSKRGAWRLFAMSNVTSTAPAGVGGYLVMVARAPKCFPEDIL